MKKRKFQPEFIAAFTALNSLIIIGTVVYHYMEGWSWIKSLYFVVATLATVGYGDVHPTTDGSRLFTVVFILIGVTVAISSISVIGTKYLAKREQSIKSRTKKLRINE
ncbi:MAG: potassium channel family protein [Candidatus Saccharibacteria bacterium]